MSGERVLAKGGISIDPGLCQGCGSPMGSARGGPNRLIFECTSCDGELTVTIDKGGGTTRAFRYRFLEKRH